MQSIEEFGDAAHIYVTYADNTDLKGETIYDGTDKLRAGDA